LALHKKRTSCLRGRFFIEPGNYVYCSLFPVSCVLFPVSCFLCPVSCVLFPVSCVLCPVSCVLCPVSCVLCPVSCVLCPVDTWSFCWTRAVALSQRERVDAGTPARGEGESVGFTTKPPHSPHPASANGRVVRPLPGERGTSNKSTTQSVPRRHIRSALLSSRAR
jgi:hypothetical protein